MIPLREMMMMPYLCFFAFIDFLGISRADMYVIKVFLTGAATGALLSWCLS